MSKKNKILCEDDTFTFGEHKGETIMEVLESDPGYIVWACDNIKWFEVEDYILSRAEEDSDERRAGADYR